MNTHKTPPLSVPDDLPEVMDLQEASTYLRLKPRTLTRLATLGEVPAAKIGKQWRLHREALAKLFVPAGSLRLGLIGSVRYDPAHRNPFRFCWSAPPRLPIEPLLR